MKIKHKLYTFNQLSGSVLYEILKLRSEVFVVEQACIYLDMDDKDQESLHVTLWENSKLIAYSRILPAGASFSVPAIGRVITSPTHRGRGLGKQLMQYALQGCYENFGQDEVRLNAQVQVIPFYESLGFYPCGEIFLEDGIEHRTMFRPYAPCS